MKFFSSLHLASTSVDIVGKLFVKFYVLREYFVKSCLMDVFSNVVIGCAQLHVLEK